MNARWLVLALVVVSLPGLAFAGANCNTATVVPTDGRILDFDFVAPSTSNYYQFSVTSGHSYSVEVREDYDDINADINTAPFTDNACTVSLGGLRNTTAIEPAVPANAQRFSFTSAATGIVYLKVTNSNGATGRYVSVSVPETTIYAPRWSTVAGFQTQWGFQNSTSAIINVAMVLSGGASLTVPAFAVPAGGEVFRSTVASDLNLAPGGAVGAALITHDGPPGAIVPDCYFLNGNASVVVPATITPPRQAAH